MAELLHFEDFTVGRKFACGPYAVTKSMLKGLSASGFHVCAMTMRMFADGVILKTANRGGAGVREVRWMKPVRPGDVLRLDVEVADAKPSASKPVGFVTFDCRVFNQREQVALVSMTPIVAKRP